MPTTERSRTLTIKMTETELRAAHALADAADESIGRFIRRVLADHYRSRFGEATPPQAKLRMGRPRKEGAR